MSVTTGWAGVRAVVTGSSGFIGANLVQDLAAHGASVVGIDRRPPDPAAPGAHVGLELTGAADRETVRELLADTDVVFHLAGRGGVRESGPQVDSERRRDNVHSAAVVLGLTHPHIPIVVTSSSSVYGGARSLGRRVRPSRESDPLHPRGGYARSKVLVERLCATRAARGGQIAVARPFTVAGEGQRPDMAVARWLAAVREGRPLPLMGSLQRRRDVTDVRDVVRGLRLLAERVPDGPVNLGTGSTVTLADLLAAVSAAVAQPLVFEEIAVPREDPPATLACVRRLQQVLGFVPSTDIEALVVRQHQAKFDLHSRAVSANMG